MTEHIGLERLTGLIALRVLDHWAASPRAARALSICLRRSAKACNVWSATWVFRFTRTTRSLALTAEGRDLHERALRLLREAEEIEQVAALAARGELSGILRDRRVVADRSSPDCAAFPRFRGAEPQGYH
jgi:hypothetical protein